MNLAAIVALGLVCLAPWAGAADVALTGAGRTGAMVPAISPNFSATLTLQRGPAVSGFGGLTDQISSLPGVAGLTQIGASWFGFKPAADSVPALPQSAVVVGESLKTLPASLPSAALISRGASALAPEQTRMTPPASEATAPATRRMQRELEDKAERLQGPLEAVAKTGANAPSTDELHRLGEEIWDMMAAPNPSAGTSVTAGEIASGAGFGRGASAPVLTVSQSLLALSDASNRESYGKLPTLGSDIYRDAASEAQDLVVNHSRSEFLAREGGDKFLAARRLNTPGGVALIAMNVVGQHLILSERGAAFRASRNAAAAISGAVESGQDSLGEASNVRMEFVPPVWTSRWNHQGAVLETAEAGGARATGSAFLDGALTPRRTRISRAGGMRGVLDSRVPQGPGLWSWAALLPLLLLGLVALPEYR